MRGAATFVVATAFIADAGAAGLYSDLYEPGSLSVDSVIGMEVVSPTGELIGTIREVLYDRATGKVEGIALDRGTLSYPIEALLAADEGRRVVAESLLDAASAGASGLVPARRPSAAAARGFVIDLREGRVRRPQPSE
jgi:sporulation protein YlmC with PRC-barrel domain